MVGAVVGNGVIAFKIVDATASASPATFPPTFNSVHLADVRPVPVHLCDGGDWPGPVECHFQATAAHSERARQSQAVDHGSLAIIRNFQHSTGMYVNCNIPCFTGL